MSERNLIYRSNAGPQDMPEAIPEVGGFHGSLASLVRGLGRIAPLTGVLFSPSPAMAPTYKDAGPSVREPYKTVAAYPVIDRKDATPTWAGFGIAPLPARTDDIEEAFTVPKVSCPPTNNPNGEMTSIWVGFGLGKSRSPTYNTGVYSPDPLYQGGITIGCPGDQTEAGARATYFAWWEEFPKNSMNFFPSSKAVSPRDRIEMLAVRHPGDRTASIVIRDYGPKPGRATPIWSDRSPLMVSTRMPSEAECIVERPENIAASQEAGSNAYTSLNDFGRINFSTVNGTRSKGCDIVQKTPSKKIVTSISKVFADWSETFPRIEAVTEYDMQLNDPGNLRRHALLRPQVGSNGAYSISYNGAK